MFFIGRIRNAIQARYRAKRRFTLMGDIVRDIENQWKRARWGSKIEFFYNDFTYPHALEPDVRPVGYIIQTFLVEFGMDDCRGCDGTPKESMRITCPGGLDQEDSPCLVRISDQRLVEVTHTVLEQYNDRLRELFATIECDPPRMKEGPHAYR